MDDATDAPLDEFSAPAPTLTIADAQEVAERYFGVSGGAKPLVSERDQNFRITDADGQSFVLKVANHAESHAVTELQVQALLHIARVDPSLPVPSVHLTLEATPLAEIEAPDGRTHAVRMVSYLDGAPREPWELDEPSLRAIGGCGARLGWALRGFFHPAAGRSLIWDPQRAGDLVANLDVIDDRERRVLAADALTSFEERVQPALPGLRAQIIHCDLHAENAVMAADGSPEVAGIIDFGDMVFAPLICDLAVTVASLMYGRSDPFEAATAICAGYSEIQRLEDVEIELLPDLVRARAAATVLIGGRRAREQPENREYILEWDAFARDVLRLFDEVGMDEVRRRFREMFEDRGAGTVTVAAGDAGDDAKLLERRRAVMGDWSPLSYDAPLHLVRGEGVWLYDAEGRAYLDAYNNVPVAGHSHPRVVQALTRQAGLLNTNTRYLGGTVVELAERLTATMPDGLDTVLFVNSGSEANDTAWRLAREATQNAGAIVTDFAYHGVTIASSDLSPEEWPEGYRPVQVATIPAPDPYRGQYREGDWPERYAEHLDEAVERLRENGLGPAITCIDGSFASDGIFAPPAAYVHEIVHRTRETGGLFVADEVQVGFGRMGKAMWSFQVPGITPDFVTLGKPMGNGHPVAAVVTRREIAEAFAERYPEFFSTFGGNTVAAAVALAVLDVVQEEGLQRNAAEVGAHLREGLLELADRHESIGDVRGAGLMIGVELVRDRETREPAAAETDAVLNAMKVRGVLIGSAGPRGNVLKVRPPLVFSSANADQLLETLDEVLTGLRG